MRRPPPSLRGKALMWLAQREHTRQELAQKLARWVRAAAARAVALEPGAPPVDTPQATDIEALLDVLQADGHLSDLRFVESRVNARIGRFGTHRIEQELRRHGAALDEAQRLQLRKSETARAQRVWAVKFGRPPSNAAERARQMRFLAGRGFSAEAIRHAVSGVDDLQEAAG